MHSRSPLVKATIAGLAVALAIPTVSTAATRKQAVKKAVKALTTGPTFVDLQNFAAGEPDHIDPQLTSTLVGAQVAILMYDSLTDTDANGDLVPAAAESWSSPDAGKTWVFKIKKGLKFSDGTPVLPSNFKAGWERAANPALASEVAYHLDPLAGKKAVDDKTATTLSGVVANDKALTLTTTLNFSFSPWPSVVSHPVFSPIPKSMFGADGKVEETGTKLVGNGPYMLKEQISKQAGGSVKLIRNPFYAGKPGSLKEIVFQITKDQSAAYNAFESGQGLTAAVPAGLYEAAKAKYGEVGLGTVLGTDYWGFNWEDPTVGGAKNLLLRKAIVQAIDRAQISTVIYQGQRKPTDQLVPRGIPGRKDGLGLGTTRNLDQAKKDFEAWKAAGNTLSAPLRLSYNEGANWDKVANIIVANLKDAGIDAKLDPFPADGTYFSKMRKGQGQIIRAGWFADYVTYDNFMYPLLHTKSIDGDNLERYSNPKFDALVDQARSADYTKSSELYSQAERIALAEDVIIMPTVNRASNVVFSSKVGNIKITPLGFVLYQELTVK